MLRKFSAAALLLAMLAAPVVAVEKVEGRASITAASRYIPNGFSFVENTVYQLGLDLDREHFGITLFGNYDTDDEIRTFNEKDCIARFAYPLGGFTPSFSYGFYQFNAPGAPDRSQDLTLGIKYDGPFTVSASAAHDFDKIGGNYGNVSVSKNVKWKVGIGGEGVVWFNDHYFTNEGGVSSSKVTGSMSADLGSNTSITAFVSHVHGLRDNFENHTFGGVKLSVDFVPPQTD